MKRAAIPVLVVTDVQLARIERLFERAQRLRDDLSEACDDLSHSLDVLRGENHPEGWATVQVVPEATVRTLVVEHKAGSRSITRGWAAPASPQADPT